MLETGLVADLSLVKAWRGDTEGNLVYRKTARNFNPMMATAGRVTVAEVEELVRAGHARAGPDPHAGHLRAAHHPRHAATSRPIENRTVRKRPPREVADGLVTR